MIVGYLTVVYDKDISEKAAHHLTNEIASIAIDMPAVDAVKCDVGNLDGTGEADFWREANEA